MIYEDLELFVKNIQVNNALIGLDLGTKTIGVAVSDKTLSVATPIKTIKRKKFSLDANCLFEISQISFVQVLFLAYLKIWTVPKDQERSQPERSPETFLPNLISQLRFGMKDYQR